MARKLKDEDLLLLMLSGKSQTVIAKELGVTKATITRRVHTKEFSDMLAQYRKKVLDGVITDLTTNAQKSVRTLVQLLDEENPNVRFNAASKILQLTQDYSLQNDLMRDIEKIKQAQQEQEV